MDEVEKQEESFVCCEVCIEENLLKNVGIAKCTRCERPFCIHFVSRIDPQYCVDCMSDMSVTKDKIIVEREFERYDEIEEKVIRYKRRSSCTQIKFEGQDWLFAQRRVCDFSEAELTLAIEYHWGLFKLLQLANEEQKAAKMHKLASVKAIRIPTTTQSTTTTVKKSTKTSSDKNAAKLSALLGSMFAKGLTPEDVAAMLKGK